MGRPMGASLGDPHDEPRAAQQPLERWVSLGRPIRHTPAWTERRDRRGNPFVAIEPGVPGRRERIRAVVDVEHYRVEQARAVLEHAGDVDKADVDPGVRQSLTPQREARVFVPRDDLRKELGDNHPGIGPKAPQRGPEREAEAEATDEDLSAGGVPSGKACQLSEPLLRRVAARGHQLDSIDANDVVAVVLMEREDAAVRRHRLPESIEFLQGRVGVGCAAVRAKIGLTSI
jgi:hypothetical protein